MTRILVTGINGFVGKHLAAELKSRGATVVGAGREPEMHLSLDTYVETYYQCDLTSAADVALLPLEDIDAVINLAGFAAVGASFDQAELYMRVNVGVLKVISERILELGLKVRMLAVSTGAVYASNQPLPLTENSKLITTGSPYALSKIAMEAEATRLRSRGLTCVVARPFNHIGPGQEPGFLVPDLYEKIIKAINTDQIVKVGNLSTRRDYTDVRDVARAYADLMLSENLSEEVYNICSGHSLAGSEIFEMLIATIPNTEKIKPEIDQQFLRADDPKDLYGDNQRLTRQTAWKPQIALKQTIEDFVRSKQA